MFCSLFCLALPAAWAETAPPSRVPNRGALFKVEQAGHTLYLFGTIHVGAADFFPLEPRVSQALERATVLALEIDPHGDPQALSGALQEYGMYAPGQPPPGDCRIGLKPRLDPLLKKYAIAPEAVAPMKPWLLASVLSISEFGMLGYQPGLAVDSYLSQQARARRIPVLQLESAAGQMGLFGRMTMAEQCRFLEDGIDGLENQEQARQAERITQAWRGADAAALDVLAAEAAADASFSGKFVQQVLLEQRNPGLADGIAGLLVRENNSLAAIGVLHLIGANNVPDLLRKRGLKVERMY